MYKDNMVGIKGSLRDTISWMGTTHINKTHMLKNLWVKLFLTNLTNLTIFVKYNLTIFVKWHLLNISWQLLLNSG